MLRERRENLKVVKSVNKKLRKATHERKKQLKEIELQNWKSSFKKKSQNGSNEPRFEDEIAKAKTKDGYVQANRDSILNSMSQSLDVSSIKVDLED